MRTVSRVAAALALLAVPLLALPSEAAAYDVPCTGNPASDGQALQAVVALPAVPGQPDTVTLATPCTYQVSQTLTVTGKALTLTTDGGRATLQGNGVQVLRVATDGVLTADRLDVIGGDDRASTGGTGSAGNLEVAGSATVTDSTLQAGQGDSAGNLHVTLGTGRLNLIRSSLVGGTATGGPTEALVGGRLSLIDSTVFGSTAANGAAVRVMGQLAQMEVFHDTFLVNGSGVALHNADGLTRIHGSVFAGSAAGCQNGSGQGLQLVAPNVSHDASCPGATVVDPRIDSVTAPPGRVHVAVPRAGSPVIDAGDPTTCGNTMSAQGYYAGPTDANGRPRTLGASCDLGSHEASSTLLVQQAAGLTAGARAQDVTVTAQGLDPVQLGPPLLTGAFVLEQTTCPATLAPGQSCTYRIAYTPTASDQEGTLTYVDNAGGTAQTQLVGKANPVALPVVRTPSPVPSPTSVRTAQPSPRPTATAPTRPLATATPTPPALPSAAPTPGPTATSLPSSGPLVTTPRLRAAGSIDDETWRARHADEDVPWFVRHLRTPDEVDLSVGRILRNALLALLLLTLLGVPVNIASKTLVAHREQAAAMVAPLRRWVPSFDQGRYSQGTLLLSTAVMTSVVDTFLDPGARWDRVSAISFVALLATVLVTTVVNRVADEVWYLGRFRLKAQTRVYPGFWLVAIACVVVSRTVGLTPGLLLGSLAGVRVARSFSTAESGQKVLYRIGVTTALALYAWALYGPLAHQAQRTHAFQSEVLASVCGALFIAGVGGTLLNLLPIGPLDGTTLVRWSPRVWAVTTFVALFGFIHVLLHKDQDDPLLEHPGYLAVLLVLYVLGCLAIVGFWWLYDRRHPGVQLAPVRPDQLEQVTAGDSAGDATEVFEEEF